MNPGFRGPEQHARGHGGAALMDLGVAGGPLPTQVDLLTAEVAAELADCGVRAVVTHFDLLALAADLAVAERARELLGDAGIRVVQAGGFRTSFVAPSDGGLERLRDALRAAAELGADMFITGCGSHDPESFYGPHPRNHAPESRRCLAESLKRAAPIAEAAGVKIALECHQLTTLDTPEHIREVLDDVDSEWVVANFDPVNLLDSAQAVWDSGNRIRHMIETVGPRYGPSAHAKDVVVVRDSLPVQLKEAAPGTGSLDWAAFFDACRALGDGTAVIVEHLDHEAAVAALGHVREAGEQHGIRFR
jgi:sugar phosphate isomerase/epimerase